MAAALLAGTLMAGSCAGGDSADSAQTALSEPEQLAGFRVLENSCVSCHSPDAGATGGIAPTLAQIKVAYATRGTSAAAFSEALVAFLNSPSPENSRMPEALEQYGLMPKMSLSQEEVSAVAAYLYHTPLETSRWYARSYAAEQERMRASQPVLPHLERGQQLAMETKAVLGSNLLKALKQGGPEHAVDFCSTRALVLTDSMSEVLGAGIRRVSDRNRNPANAVNAEELSYIQLCRMVLEKGEKPLPRLQEQGQTVTGYYPITTDALCLQCHGNPDTEISPATWTALQTRYPGDRAYGFALGDLRGIWVVEMAR